MTKPFINNFQTAYSLSPRFHNEHDLCDWLSQNMRTFCRDVLLIHYHSHAREYQIDTTKSRGRIDFVIYSTEKKVFFLECKNPNISHAVKILQAAIGQVLTYQVLAENIGMPIEKSFLLTTQFDPIIDQVISRNKLPITIVLANKTVRVLA